MSDYTGSTGYGEKFTQDIQFDPLEGPANDINEAADSAIKRFRFIDASRQVAGGASYGGPLTNLGGVSPTPPPALIHHARGWAPRNPGGTSHLQYRRPRTS